MKGNFGPAPGKGEGLVQGKSKLSPPRTETKEHGGGGLGTAAWKLTHSEPGRGVGGYVNPNAKYTVQRKEGE
jgi:hypothetical protein